MADHIGLSMQMLALILGQVFLPELGDILEVLAIFRCGFQGIPAMVKAGRSRIFGSMMIPPWNWY